MDNNESGVISRIDNLMSKIYSPAVDMNQLKMTILRELAEIKNDYKQEHLNKIQQVQR